MYISSLQRRLRTYPMHAVWLSIIGICASLLVIRLLNYNPTHHNTWFSSFSKQTWKCVYDTDNPLLQAYSQATKTKSYIPFASEQENKTFVQRCLITVWHMIHFVGYAVVAFTFPMFWPEILMASFGFEFYEYISCNCHDVTDLLYNSAGVALGVYMRKLIHPVK